MLFHLTKLGLSEAVTFNFLFFFPASYISKYINTKQFTPYWKFVLDYSALIANEFRLTSCDNMTIGGIKVKDSLSFSF